MCFVVRNVLEKELSSCITIFLEEFNRIGGHWTKTTAKKIIFEAFERYPDYCFCLDLEGKIIGFFWCEPFNGVDGKSLFFNGFSISKKQQGKGFGLKALQFLDGFAKENGFNAIWLDTNPEKKAFEIYNKFGFNKTGNVIMKKILKK